MSAQPPDSTRTYNLLTAIALLRAELADIRDAQRELDLRLDTAIATCDAIGEMADVCRLQDGAE